MMEELDQEIELTEPTPPDQHRSETPLEDLDSIRPEGLPEKFWDARNGSIRTDSLLKSYLQLEKRFGEQDVDRAPTSAEDYEISTDGPFVTVDPTLNEKLHEAGFTQGEVLNLLGIW